MRLGQLARQLSIKPDEIVNFLADQGIPIENNNNARIEDSFVETILKHFAPNDEALLRVISQQPELPDNDYDKEEEIEQALPSAGPTQTGDEPEVIKAPKVELPGLRVLGKIELPEKKKPEPAKEEAMEAMQPSPQRRTQRMSPPRQQKNPIAQARERQELERRQKMMEQREKEKQRKTEFYLKRLKHQGPTKSARINRDEYIEMPPLEPEAPKTWWGRFMRWLNR